MYDITIIGAGVSGIFAAHTLMEHSSGRVLLLDKGKPLEERSCPQERGLSCDCRDCSAYCGFGGLGRSEGKYNFTGDFGGELEEMFGPEALAELMNEVDRVLCLYGASAAEPYRTHSDKLADRASASGLKLLTSTVRHLGTKLSSQMLEGFQTALQSGIDMRFETTVSSIEQLKRGEGYRLHFPGGDTVDTKNLLLATGRSGSGWLPGILRPLGLEPRVTRLDLGLRLEMPGGQLDSILQETFETKLRYTETEFSATTYCMNPNGGIVRKRQEGLVMADGQNFRERDSGSRNLNFSLFIPRHFATLELANQYAAKIIGAVNRGGERIAVQRLADLLAGRRTTAAALAANSVQPSLEADPAQLTEELPVLYIQATLKFLEALERLLGCSINGDTLLYALDGKFYAPKMETDTDFQTALPGLYAIGDCSGRTHSLSQAAASGIHAARRLLRE
ncbi:NAD(FAD)-utilizing dehydrogenase [Paenibacillus pasadenensis]|uniref:NAD(P)/FAD-dependent oxidoreductase n=1 Tax=Paenibacillus pasadenensis TaxID=217090 RepID=UPI00203EC9EC|nr:NAD(FAD)-utilizing dehydrogenase [Paenibacillus pasadenensis]MCM3746297.1 NAD(FAD)-utilizing dehydrogenase [Paenibacillus pasadenensis]